MFVEPGNKEPLGYWKKKEVKGAPILNPFSARGLHSTSHDVSSITGTECRGSHPSAMFNIQTYMDLQETHKKSAAIYDSDRLI
ncbi:uncharacterized protein LOC143764637 isoform X3 [Ranitomeya variabilis]|uniref:uncharacterized protein LOC143764637 isoform X3 n=1 Tax=Ranitomeya variabilis TaxID=490064 RepID=UPI0040563528